MRTKLGRILCVLAITLVAVSSHGESGFRRSLASAVTTPEPYLDQLATTACPRSDKAWTEKRDEIISHLLTLHAPDYERLVDGKWTHVAHDDAYLNLLVVMKRSTKIGAFLHRCHGPDTIVGNLRQFVTSQDNANYARSLDNQFGHRITDQDYLRRSSVALDLPCLLKSQDFLKAISDPKSYSEALTMIGEHNAGKARGECPAESTQWTTLLYRSRFISTPDKAQTFGRLLVVAPGEDYDRWVQFGIWTKEDLDSGADLLPIRNVSVVAVARHPEQPGGAKFDAIADFYRCENNACGETVKRTAKAPCPAASSGIQLCSRLDVTGETDDCERCHKMTPNSIHPERVYEFDSSGKWVVLDDRAAAAAAERLNTRIATLYARLPLYELPPGDDAVAAWKSFGAIGLGADPTSYKQSRRTSAYVQACAARANVRLSESSADKVGDAMNCSECHGAHKSDPSIGVLNYPLATEKRRSGPIRDKSGEVHVPDLVEAHILSGVMPLTIVGDQITAHPLDLTPDERKALYACVSDEYLHASTHSSTMPTGLFVDWLRNQGDKGQPPPSTFVGIAPEKTAAKVASARRLLLEAPVPCPSGDGAKEFACNCGRCHAVVAGEGVRRGPNLFGVFERRIGADAAFAKLKEQNPTKGYSNGITLLAAKPDMKWDEANLMAFLADPDHFLSSNGGGSDGSNMENSFPDAALRQRIVDYLKTLK